MSAAKSTDRTPERAVVYVVDDDSSVRGAARSLLRSLGLRVETFASGEEFFRYQRPDIPSCLVLDVFLQDSSGLDLPRALEASGDPIPVIFMTAHGTIPMGVRAMKEGAVEFLTKPVHEEELIASIGRALERDRAAKRVRAELAQLRQRWERLTPREQEVVVQIATGRLNKQIAHLLGTVEQTVKVHRMRGMQKLGTRSVAELVRAMERIAGQPWATFARSANSAADDSPPSAAEPGPEARTRARDSSR